MYRILTPKTTITKLPNGYVSISFPVPGTTKEIYVAGLREDKAEEIRDKLLEAYDDSGRFYIVDESIIDTEKTADCEIDNNLCFAAAGCNMLYYTGWYKMIDPDLGLLTEDDLFEKVIPEYTDTPDNLFFVSFDPTGALPLNKYKTSAWTAAFSADELPAGDYRAEAVISAAAGTREAFLCNNTAELYFTVTEEAAPFNGGNVALSINNDDASHSCNTTILYDDADPELLKAAEDCTASFAHYNEDEAPAYNMSMLFLPGNDGIPNRFTIYKEKAVTRICISLLADGRVYHLFSPEYRVPYALLSFSLTKDSTDPFSPVPYMSTGFKEGEKISFVIENKSINYDEPFTGQYYLSDAKFYGKQLSEPVDFSIEPGDEQKEFSITEWKTPLKKKTSLYLCWVKEGEIYNYNNCIPAGTLEVLPEGAKDVSELSISGIADKTHTGKEITQKVVVKDGDKELVPDTDYSLTYENNVDVGKASVIIEGAGNYTGKVTKTFAILPAASKKVTIYNVAQGLKVTWLPVEGATRYHVYRGDERIKTTSKLEITDGDVKMNLGERFTYKVVATAAGAGDSLVARTGTYYRLLPVGIRTVKNTAAGKMTVTYDKSPGSSGYVVRFGLKSDMSDAKVITVKGEDTLSRTFSGLTKGKTYYVQVRTYKIVDGIRYYSAYCTTKTVKISK